MPKKPIKRSKAASKTKDAKPQSSSPRKPAAGSRGNRPASKSQGKSREELEASVHKLIAGCPRVWAAIQEVIDAKGEYGEDSPKHREAAARCFALQKKAQKRENAAATASIPLSSEDPREPDAIGARREIHLDLLTSGLYAKIMAMAGGHACSTQFGGYNEFHATTLLYAHDVLKSMKPRDSMEAMLISQALWNHARIAHLNNFLLEQRDIELVKDLNEAIDRASNTYRRQLLALAEYRRPPKPGGTYNRIHQANIAEQQIVQNSGGPGSTRTDSATEKPSNELRLEHERSEQDTPKTLPADGCGTQSTLNGGASQPAVAGLDRP